VLTSVIMSSGIRLKVFSPNCDVILISITFPPSTFSQIRMPLRNVAGHSGMVSCKCFCDNSDYSRNIPAGSRIGIICICSCRLLHPLVTVPLSYPSPVLSYGLQGIFSNALYCSAES
jgi:hypothetical protein